LFFDKSQLFYAAGFGNKSDNEGTGQGKGKRDG
jgi:hypothetical protein